MTQLLIIGTGDTGKTALTQALAELASQKCEVVIVGGNPAIAEKYRAATETMNSELLRGLFARKPEALPNLEEFRRRDKIISESKAKHAAKEARRAKRFK